MQEHVHAIVHSFEHLHQCFSAGCLWLPCPCYALQVWNSPHNIRIAGSKFAVDTVSQGALQWQVRRGMGSQSLPPQFVRLSFATSLPSQELSDWLSASGLPRPKTAPHRMLSFWRAKMGATWSMGWTTTLRYLDPATGTGHGITMYYFYQPANFWGFMSEAGRERPVLFG